MGSLILCHKKKAKQPYLITRIHCRIYSLEELCYYICNNLYLIDYTIMNEPLCNWLAEELELGDLARSLRDLLKNNSSIEYFVLSILMDSEIYTPVEINHIKMVLERLKNEKDIERLKAKADNLLENGEVEEAILIYLAIINGDKDEAVPPKFYGNLHACLGAAYGRSFLYEEAMEMYDKAFQICSDTSMLTAYIYAASRTLSREKYRIFLEKSDVFKEIDILMQKELHIVEEKIKQEIEPSDELLENWKKQYRKSHS